MWSRVFSSRPRAYTLIEVLVVVVLMALVAAAFVPSLARTSRSAERDRLVADLIQLDTLARQRSLNGSQHELRWEPTTRELVLSVRQDEPQIVRQVQVPAFVEVEILSPEGVVRFNVLGQSPDYGYQVRNARSMERIDFNGLSGWYEVRSDAE